jgi:hypothetical protein
MIGSSHRWPDGCSRFLPARQQHNKGCFLSFKARAGEEFVLSTNFLRKFDSARRVTKRRLCATGRGSVIHGAAR